MYCIVLVLYCIILYCIVLVLYCIVLYCIPNHNRTRIRIRIVLYWLRGRRAQLQPLVINRRLLIGKANDKQREGNENGANRESRVADSPQSHAKPELESDRMRNKAA